MKPTILLIEDDDDDAFIFKEVLREVFSHCILHHVHNGLEGIRLLRNLNPAFPAAIILDWNMPIMSGKEFLFIKRGEENLKEIPTFVFTTATDNFTKEDAINSGASGFYSKPSNIKELESLMHEMLFSTIK